jgi:hypothetical protein
MRASIETFIGREFYPLAPSSGDVDIRDIAHALSNQCRFSGHCRSFYSVAEHSVRVSEWLSMCEAPIPLWGLLHDASEAYLVDLPTPLKSHPVFAKVYRQAEKKLMKRICFRFSLPIKEPIAVQLADAKLLATEVRDLMPANEKYWAKLEEFPLPDRIVPWSPTVAEGEFLRRYTKLTGLTK